VLNEKQEKFAQAYILHRNATDAAKAAGYTPRSAYNQGYRLLQDSVIQERIEDLERELETSVDVIEEIENQYAFAKTQGHTNSAIKALELLSRIRGHKSDKNKEISREDLHASIVKSMEILGQDEVTKLIKKCKFD
jgi:phage terminase small subunit|tara:strand:+ start:69 stop:476 length:408 start_codon:yes stop_codon:yes gene_type:complete